MMMISVAGALYSIVLTVDVINTDTVCRSIPTVEVIITDSVLSNVPTVEVPFTGPCIQ